jgi:hypothetical protein
VLAAVRFVFLRAPLPLDIAMTGLLALSGVWAMLYPRTRLNRFRRALDLMILLTAACSVVASVLWLIRVAGGW